MEWKYRNWKSCECLNYAVDTCMEKNLLEIMYQNVCIVSLMFGASTFGIVEVVGAECGCNM